MKSAIKTRSASKQRKKSYGYKDIELAMEFAKRVNKELAGLVSAVILFGSTFRRISPSKKPSKDVDIMVILDDVRVVMTPELIQTYRIIVQKIISDVDKEKLHVQILNLTAWWGYVRAGDPVATTILRDGFALIDTGFFDPLQALLDEGKIRPSEESVWTYMNMSEASLYRAEGHLLSATMDLYWAVVDGAHAALMAVGIIPHIPKFVGDALRETFVSTGELAEKHAKTMDLFYQVSKDIVHKKTAVINLTDYKKYKILASEFVDKMKKLVKKNSAAILKSEKER
tara:strand:- start:58 stop:912 length:855 start_codon:yes stop_codon:yes gene_type:complete